MGRANPTAELILHPPCLIHSHDNLHPIRKLKYHKQEFHTRYRTKKEPPGRARARTNQISKDEKPKERQFLSYTILPVNQHFRLPVERSSAE